jgi:hypothetical protein
MSRPRPVHPAQVISLFVSCLLVSRQWLAKIREAGVRRRAERLYEQLDMLRHLRQQARRELLAESRKHPITANCASSVPRWLEFGLLKADQTLWVEVFDNSY